MNKSEKCVLLGYKGESIYRLYNLIKKKVIRVNSVHFVKKRPLFVNPEKEIEAYKHPVKRQRLTVIPASAVGEISNEQRITDVSEDVAPIAPRIVSNPRPTVTPAALRVTLNSRSVTSVVAESSTNLRSNFLWSANKRLSTSGSFKAAIPAQKAPISRTTQPNSALRDPSQTSSPATAERNSSDISSPSTVMKMVREDSELSAIQRILLDYSNLTISNLRDLSPDFLAGVFAAFALLADHINKPNIFKPTIYEQAIFNRLNRIN